MKKLLCILLIVTCFLGLTACGGAAEVIPDMQQVYDSMKDKLPEMEPFSADYVLNSYGIDSASCKQMVVSSYYDGADTAEIWLIEAADEAAAQELKSLVKTRLDSMEAQFASYDQAAYQVVKDAQLITHGNCIALIVAEDVDALTQIYKDAAQLK